MTKPHVILVAGFNYMWDGTSYAKKCEYRAQWLRRKLPHATFSLFDFGEGILRVSEEDEKGKRHKPDPPAGMMSVTDVYDYVKRLGRGEKDAGSAGTLVELSFFSHGFFQGPVLVNSFDRQKNSNERDPKDKDPRHSKDFMMSKDDRAAFQKAFAKGAVVWVWGCNGTSDYYIVFDRLKNTPKYPHKASGRTIPDNQVIEFNAIKKKDEAFFLKRKEVFTPGHNEHTFESTMKKIKAFYQDGIKDTYMSNVATFAKVLAHGALPGMEAVNGKDGLMAVPTNFETEKTNHTPFIEFYKTYLNAAEDEEGRHYGKYLPGDTIVTPFGSLVVK